MKKQRDLIKELDTKKYNRPPWFRALGYYLLGSTYWVGAKFRPHYTKTDKIGKGPAFLIWNHQNRRDEHMAAHMSFPRRVSILCEYNEFFRSHLHFMLRRYPAIPKKVYANDIVSLRAMTKAIREGGVVMFSPEGTPSLYGSNQPVIPGTGAFIKHFKVPVYACINKGGYLSNPKFDCYYDRLGEVYAEQKLLFSPEDLARMTPEEIEDKINDEFSVDDFEWNKKMRIPFKREKPGSLTDKMEYAYYLCPKCGKEYVMKSTPDNKIVCTHCGNEAIYNEYGDLIPSKGSVFPSSPTEWGHMERRKVIEDIRKDPNYEIKIHAWIGEMPRYHYLKKGETSERCGEGIIRINHEGFFFDGIRNEKEYHMHLSYKELYSLMILLDFTFFMLFFNNDCLEFHPDDPIVMKMVLTVEEMHRFHVNTWKNLKRLSYLYDNLDEITVAKK